MNADHCNATFTQIARLTDGHTAIRVIRIEAEHYFTIRFLHESDTSSVSKFRAWCHSTDICIWRGSERALQGLIAELDSQCPLTAFNQPTVSSLAVNRSSSS